LARFELTQCLLGTLFLSPEGKLTVIDNKSANGTFIGPHLPGDSQEWQRLNPLEPSPPFAYSESFTVGDVKVQFRPDAPDSSSVPTDEACEPHQPSVSVDSFTPAMISQASAQAPQSPQSPRDSEDDLLGDDSDAPTAAPVASMTQALPAMPLSDTADEEEEEAEDAALDMGAPTQAIPVEPDASPSPLPSQAAPLLEAATQLVDAPVVAEEPATAPPAVGTAAPVTKPATPPAAVPEKPASSAGKRTGPASSKRASASALASVTAPEPSAEPIAANRRKRAKAGDHTAAAAAVQAPSAPTERAARKPIKAAQQAVVKATEEPPNGPTNEKPSRKRQPSSTTTIATTTKTPKAATTTDDASPPAKAAKRNGAEAAPAVAASKKPGKTAAPPAAAPATSKRKAAVKTEDASPPVAKAATRDVVAPSTSTSTRAKLAKAPARSSTRKGPRVQFTGVIPNADALAALAAAGGAVDEESPTHIVVPKGKVIRTAKLLKALARVGADAPRVVHDGWVRDGLPADCSGYAPFDNDYEGRKLNMAAVLAKRDKAREGLLAGTRVLATAGVQPPRDELEAIVEAAGGSFGAADKAALAKAVPESTVVLATETDLKPLSAQVKKLKLTATAIGWLTHALVDGKLRARDEWTLQRGAYELTR